MLGRCSNCKGTGTLVQYVGDGGIRQESTCVICDGEGISPRKLWRDIGAELGRFAKEQAEWSAKTFGPKEVKNSEGPWKHCAKEILVEILGIPKLRVEEFFNETLVTNQPKLKDIKEIADVMFFVNEGLWRMGMTWEQLIIAMHAKLIENKARPWPKFDPAKVNQPVEHIRENDNG
jgi:hypothetical protein